MPTRADIVDLAVSRLTQTGRQRMNRQQPVRTRTRDIDHGSLLVTETKVLEHAWEDRLLALQQQMDKLKAQVRQAQQLAHLGTVAAVEDCAS